MDGVEAGFPIIPHSAAGVDCGGCIVVTVYDDEAELTCNACGANAGVILTSILRHLVSLIPSSPERP